MNLLLDVGNTRIKWVLADDNEDFTACGRFESDVRAWPEGFSVLQTTVPDTAVQGIAVASVIGSELDALLCEHLKAVSDVPPWFAQVQAQSCGLRCAYEDHRQLGIDRWLVSIAAWQTFRQAVCVIDYGSAVSLDVVDADGRHLGGYVVPGLGMMKRALSRDTARIFSHSSIIADRHPGTDTAACVSNGCLGALAGFSEYLLRQVQENLGSVPCCVVTGGDAEQILSAVNFSFQRDEHLLFKGLQLLFAERT